MLVEEYPTSSNVPSESVRPYPDTILVTGPPPEPTNDNPEPFGSMRFIQIGSQELEYDTKPKTVKVIGRYVLGDSMGEGFCLQE